MKSTLLVKQKLNPTSLLPKLPSNIHSKINKNTTKNNNNKNKKKSKRYLYSTIMDTKSTSNIFNNNKNIKKIEYNQENNVKIRNDNNNNEKNEKNNKTKNNNSQSKSDNITKPKNNNNNNINNQNNKNNTTSTNGKNNVKNKKVQTPPNKVKPTTDTNGKPDKIIKEKEISKENSNFNINDNNKTNKKSNDNASQKDLKEKIPSETNTIITNTTCIENKNKPDTMNKINESIDTNINESFRNEKKAFQSSYSVEKMSIIIIIVFLSIIGIFIFIYKIKSSHKKSQHKKRQMSNVTNDKDVRNVQSLIFRENLATDIINTYKNIINCTDDDHHDNFSDDHQKNYHGISKNYKYEILQEHPITSTSQYSFSKNNENNGNDVISPIDSIYKSLKMYQSMTLPEVPKKEVIHNEKQSLYDLGHSNSIYESMMHPNSVNMTIIDVPEPAFVSKFDNQ
ncbi:hypothetical protein PIROE2DRAFT_6088 [Piromyces sp. E2]|nr:hypothetical protein PIROE2DRAFT_6088 [Piromyces sp. E2]|eukprot:OUM66667.1 hypothetical protein PIROE2DRAFT_6088 [Piromyces sp. E2]